MSDTAEQYYRYRKFCKVIGLHSIFSYFTKGDDTFYETSQLDKTKLADVYKQLSISEGNNDNNTLPITKDTILFITADSADKDKKIKVLYNELDENGNKIKDIESISVLSECDTMLWVNGSIYCLSQSSVKSINYSNGNYIVVYSDGKTEEIVITSSGEGSNYSTVFPLEITQVGNTKKIHFSGTNSMNNQTNFIVNIKNPEINISEDNIDPANFNYLTIFGKGNIASSDGQIILGDYNEEKSNSKFILCNGISDSERKNLFTVSNEGIVRALKDFVLSTGTNEITHKLSDIHSVTADDWYKEPKYGPEVDYPSINQPTFPEDPPFHGGTAER